MHTTLNMFEANPPSSLQVFIMTCKERFWQITISWNLVRDFDSIKCSSLLLEIFVVLGRRALVLSQCFCQGHFEGELIPNLSVLEMTCTQQWEDMLPICFSRIFYFCHATWSRFVGVLPLAAHFKITTNLGQLWVIWIIFLIKYYL